MSRSHDKSWCPVLAWDDLLSDLYAEGATSDTFVYTYVDSAGRRRNMTGNLARTLLRDHIENYTDYAAYGLIISQIGLHSLRSPSAMAMYMNHVPVYTIMLLGRWSSDAFLRYIRRQVEEFSSDVAARMVQASSYHYTHGDSDPHDPRAHHSAAFTANMGLGSGRNINRSAFSLW